MKKYKIDKRKLIKDFFDLKKDIEKASIDEILINNYYLECIKCILFNNYTINIPPYLFTNKDKLIKHISDTIDAYSTKFQKDIIIRSENKFNISKSIPFFTIKDNNISLEEQFNLINKNFSNTNKLKSAHNNIFNPINKQLNISKFGDDYFVGTNNEGYINNKNNNTISDYLSLSHEIGHFDEYILTNDRISKSMVLKDKYNLNNYQEVYSIFYELIATYNLYKENYITEKQMSYYLNEIKNNNTFNIEYYILCLNYLNGTYNNNLKYVRLLKTSIENISMYYYSYLVATSLFEKYLSDEEKAFYNLNYLVNNLTFNNESNILKYCDIDLYDLNDVKKHINKIKRNSDLK